MQLALQCVILMFMSAREAAACCMLLAAAACGGRSSSEPRGIVHPQGGVGGMADRQAGGQADAPAAGDFGASMSGSNANQGGSGGSPEVPPEGAGAATGGTAGSDSGATAGDASGGAAPLRGGCGGKVLPDYQQHCVGIDLLALSDARLAMASGGSTLSPGQTFEVSVTLTNPGNSVSPRVGLIPLSADVQVLGSNPYPPLFSVGPGSVQVIAGRAKLGPSVASGSTVKLMACVTGGSVECPTGARLELDIPVN